MHMILDIATNPLSSYRMHKTRKGKGSMPQMCLFFFWLGPCWWGLVPLTVTRFEIACGT